MKAVGFAAESGHIRCPERGILWHFFIKRTVYSSKYNRQSRKVLSGGKSAKAKIKNKKQLQKTFSPM